MLKKENEEKIKPEVPELQDDFFSFLAKVFRRPVNFKQKSVKPLKQEKIKKDFQQNNPKIMPRFTQRFFNLSFKKLRKNRFKRNRSPIFK